jgi:hypothetical protein
VLTGPPHPPRCASSHSLTAATPPHPTPPRGGLLSSAAAGARS